MGILLRKDIAEGALYCITIRALGELYCTDWEFFNNLKEIADARLQIDPLQFESARIEQDGTTMRIDFRLSPAVLVTAIQNRYEYDVPLSKLKLLTWSLKLPNAGSADVIYCGDRVEWLTHSALIIDDRLKGCLTDNVLEKLIDTQWC